MDGPQDLGGKMNFGPIAPEADEPIFHHDWEARVLGLTIATNGLGHWSIDEGRHARESLSPQAYYSLSYYEIWLEGLTALLKKHGEVTEDELAQGRALTPAKRPDKKVTGAAMPGVLASGGPSLRPSTQPAKFSAGQRVRTCRAHPAGHTRLPAYARDKVGVIEASRGMHVFPDTNAHGEGEQPQWLYTVVFEGRDLWGADAEAGLSCTIDAWESYLEPA
ncbi:nitrile hydratase subunit beta [Gymnodinialimonas sp.]